MHIGKVTVLFFALCVTDLVVVVDSFFADLEACVCYHLFSSLVQLCAYDAFFYNPCNSFTVWC